MNIYDLPWNKGQPVNYEKLAVQLFDGQKEALEKYSNLHGSTLTIVIRRLVDKLLVGEVDLAINQRIRKSKGTK